MNTELYNDIMKDVSKIISEKMNTERESRKLNNLCHDINFMYNKHSVIDGNAVIN